MRRYLHALRRATRGESGFTLIELLVVVLIIGVLAAIALPTFLSQQTKARDASAQSAAANLRVGVEACFVEAGDYGDCVTASQVPVGGLSWGTSAGQVQVQINPLGVSGVLVQSVSKSGNVFAYLRTLPDRQVVRVCQASAGRSIPYGGCQSGGPYAAYGYGTW